MQNQTLQSIFVLLNKKRGKCVLKTDRVKPTMKSHEFEEKLQKEPNQQNIKIFYLTEMK